MVEHQNELTESQIKCAAGLLPEVQVLTAMRFITCNGKLSEKVDAGDLVEAVIRHASKIEAGDLKRVNRYLYAQGVALSLMFDKLIAQMGSSHTLREMEAYANLALKAQNQARVTFQALADIKNPKTTVIQQQNNAINQQVNNTIESEKRANELLMEAKHEALDFGRAAETIEDNTVLETLGAVNWCIDDRG